MSIVEHPFLCDVCGKRRQNDTNHWWLVWEWTWDDNPTPFAVPTDPANQRTGFGVLPWITTEEALKPGRKHVCGVNCATRLLERGLTHGTIDLVVAQEQISKATKH